MEEKLIQKETPQAGLFAGDEKRFRSIIAEVVEEVLCRVIGNQPKEEPKYLTRKEAATLIHITLPTLRKWVLNGTIQERRIGSRILYSEDELSQAIKDRRVFKYKRGEA